MHFLPDHLFDYGRKAWRESPKKRRDALKTAILTKKSKILIKAKLTVSNNCLLGLLGFMIFCILTLYPPRGGEISPPLEKMWYNFYVDLAKIFNSWWFFKLKPLTSPGEVIFLFCYWKLWKIQYQNHLIQMIFRWFYVKTQTNLRLNTFFDKSHCFVINLTFKWF